MPDRLTSYISIPKPAVIQEKDFDKARAIETLEADNFELRNQITRLKLHNTTLRRMLEHRDQGLMGSEGASPQ